MNNNFDSHSHPLFAMWETNARPGPQISEGAFSPSEDDLELTDSEAEQLIRDVAALAPPTFVFAGFDPLRRSNIYSLVQYAASCGLHPLMVLGSNSTITRNVIADLKKAGLSRLGLTVEGGTEQSHDRIAGLAGSFARTMEAIQWANECRLPLQIHSNISRRNLHEIEQIASVIKPFRILSWNLSFPVPRPGESLHDRPSAREFEEAFGSIYKVAQELPCKVKTVQAPHYRRFVVQQRTRLRAGTGGLMVLPMNEVGIPGILPINEGRASIFISNTGEICPDQSLRVSAGNVRRHKLVNVYRHSALFESLRSPENLKGKCGECEFKVMCGGSRARAWALSGDMFAEEPNCSYLPILERKIS
jgi:radical SAM protein with 4Fe4S-binding SPASM domain